MKKNSNSKSNFGVLGWCLIIYMALTFFITGLGGSVQNITAGIFEQMYGWSSAFVISLNSIGGWIGAVFIFFFGMFMSRGKLKLRSTILISGIAVGVCYIIMGNTGSLVLYALIFCIYQIFYSLWAQLANQALCNNWFPRKKGVAIGWATMGFPLAPSLGLVLFATLLGKAGLSTAYIAIGAFAIVLCIAAAIIFTDYPEQRGLFPDNDKTLSREQADKELAEGREMIEKSPWSLKRMLTTKEVWLLFIPCGFIGFFAAGSISQVVPRLLSIGYTSDAATGMISACALIAVPGSYIIGFIDSKLGTKKAYIISMIMVIVSCILYSIANHVTIWIGLIIIGVALGGSSNFAMSLTTSYWGRFHFQKAFGVTLTITQLISNAGAICIAYTAAKWNYSVAYIGIAVLSVVMILIIMPVKDDFTSKYEERFAAEDAEKA